MICGLPEMSSASQLLGSLCHLLLGSRPPSCSRTPQAEELGNSGKVLLHLEAGFGGQVLVREGLGWVVDVGLPASALGGRGHHPGVCLYGFCPHDIMTFLTCPPNVVPLGLGF